MIPCSIFRATLIAAALAVVAPSAFPFDPSDFVGIWKGHVQLARAKMPLTLTIKQHQDQFLAEVRMRSGTGSRPFVRKGETLSGKVGPDITITLNSDGSGTVAGNDGGKQVTGEFARQ